MGTAKLMLMADVLDVVAFDILADAAVDKVMVADILNVAVVEGGLADTLALDTLVDAAVEMVHG